MYNGMIGFLTLSTRKMSNHSSRHRKEDPQQSCTSNGCMTFLGSIIVFSLAISVVQGIQKNVQQTFDPQLADHDRMTKVVGDFMENIKNRNFEAACGQLESRMTKACSAIKLEPLRRVHPSLFVGYSKLGASDIEFQDLDMAYYSGNLFYPGPDIGDVQAIFVREAGDWRIRAVKLCMGDPVRSVKFDKPPRAAKGLMGEESKCVELSA